MSDDSQLSKLGLPVVLLGAIWSAFGVVVQSYTLIDNRRDTAFSIKRAPQATAVEIANANHLFWSDWFPLWLGTLWFCLLYAVILATIPKLIHDFMPARNDIKYICWLAASLPAIGVIFMLICGVADIYYYLKH